MAILSISHIGASVAGGWFGGQLAPNGCIYGVPGNSDAVLKIDPTTDTVTTFGSVAAVTGITTPQNSYFDGVLVGTDIYCVPHDGGIYPNQPVLVIHTSTDTLSAFGAVPGDRYWGRSAGGVRVGSRIWFVPCHHGTTNDPTSPIRSVDTTVPQVDTHGSTASLGGGSASRWWRGSLVGSVIYCAARDAPNILKIDTTTGNGSAFGSISGADKWRDIVYAAGKLWLIPNGEYLRTIDPSTDTISSSLGGTRFYSAGLYIPAVDRIYAIGGANVLEINPNMAGAGGGVGQVTTSYTPLPTTGYSALVAVPSLERMYGIPSASGSGQRVLRIDIRERRPRTSVGILVAYARSAGVSSS